MEVLSLELANFRNYQTLRLEPGPGLNVFVGENAQGKSNLLEALYILATTKSTRAGRDTELIRHETGLCRIKAEVKRESDIDVRLELAVSTVEKKQAFVNGSKHTKMADVIGKVNAVLFDWGDLEIVRGEPSVRRRFLDLEISQTSPRYVHALAAYRKSLEQRNHLLKDLRDRRAGHGANETLKIWDLQLASFGAQLIDGRRAFLERLAVLASDAHRSLSSSRDELVIAYQPSFAVDGIGTVDAIREEFLAQLQRVQYEERARGTTLIGPQRDDILFQVNNGDCRYFGSQGQQRTVALGLKFAERQLIEELVGEPPLLLLDDVLSDLDDLRRGHLFEFIGKAGSQTFLSCTSIRSFPPDILEQAAVWRVVKGGISRQLV
ncbi:MAG TPA: DNA replication/repair protein RecF [Capsulimonadaceae bacterium]|jgi:DNA replication and repair protein RecF